MHGPSYTPANNALLPHWIYLVTRQIDSNQSFRVVCLEIPSPHHHTPSSRLDQLTIRSAVNNRRRGGDVFLITGQHRTADAIFAPYAAVGDTNNQLAAIDLAKGA